ncbi:MAG TPA: bacterial transcriptional activator domain-containing protein [Actinomycetes bacterium]|nr:bacterial transcriptional activator domain-containing protein [Actinomycetes bacterium]
MLAYLVLADRPPPRSRVSELLFPEPRDPLRALRWNLTELRRVLGAPDPVGGDPLRLCLQDQDEVDVHQVLTRSWLDPTQLDLLGGELLEGLVFETTPAFASWLDLERERLRAATEALLAEAAVAKLAGGEPEAAAGLAWRAVRLDELDARHHALLVASLVACGDAVGARAHVARCTRLYREQLGTGLPVEIGDALQPVTLDRPTLVPAAASVRTALDTGRPAIAAGAVAHGLRCLRQAAGLARPLAPRLRAEAMLELGTALVHSTGDRGVLSLRCLHEAFECAQHAGADELAAQAARELGFVQVQLGRRERADAWLDRAERLASGPGAAVAHPWRARHEPVRCWALRAGHDGLHRVGTAS